MLENDDYAFPVPSSAAHNGMTLRDWIAGQAMNSQQVWEQSRFIKDHELTNLFGKNRTNIKRVEIISALAYELADAMLVERKKAK